jgi:hypothetical protein
MNAFFLLYALTITLELVLSLVMAIFLYLILAPAGSRGARTAPEPPRVRPLARTVEGALGDAFAAVSEGRDDLATIANARALLERYARRDGSSRAAG